MPRNSEKKDKIGKNKNKNKKVIVVDDSNNMSNKKKIESNKSLEKLAIRGPLEETENDLFDLSRIKKDKEFDENEEPVDETLEKDEEDELGDNAGEIDDEDKDISPESEKDEEEEQIDVEFEEKKEDKEEDYAFEEEKCFYNYADEKSDDEQDLELTFDDDAIEETSDVVPVENRITKPFLSKYERVRILGDRTQQLTLGAKPMIKNAEDLTPKQIAELELKNNIIPLIIVRPLPNGKKEKWFIKELKH